MKFKGFKNGLLLSHHAVMRIRERTSFSSIEILRALHLSKYAQLAAYINQPNVPKHELKTLIEKTLLTVSELKVNDIIDVRTQVFLLLWSEPDQKYYVLVLIELDETWLVVTVLPIDYWHQTMTIVKFSEKCEKAKKRMIGNPEAIQYGPFFERYNIEVIWRTEENWRGNFKKRKLKKPILSYQGNTEFRDIALELSDGHRPEKIVVRSVKDSDNIFITLD